MSSSGRRQEEAGTMDGTCQGRLGWMAPRAETGPVAELSETVTEGEAHPSACLLEDHLGANDEWRLSRGGDDMGANVETEGRGGQVPPGEEAAQQSPQSRAALRGKEAPGPRRLRGGSP
ncbi:hypothetical protein CPLU01_06773 [Colletotrichum plurivorum]|uniref:Uncharacterized protein n=1 Tax=Colletotrichum plurivorum TaxID=2175906 RepID=A0A8H6KGY0_9PEZI|nr:hypothetical protein CPLU01_06773 [Colletotrichum plurivorum]